MQGAGRLGISNASSAPPVLQSASASSTGADVDTVRSRERVHQHGRDGDDPRSCDCVRSSARKTARTASSIRMQSIAIHASPNHGVKGLAVCRAVGWRSPRSSGYKRAWTDPAFRRTLPAYGPVLRWRISAATTTVITRENVRGARASQEDDADSDLESVDEQETALDFPRYSRHTGPMIRA